MTLAIDLGPANTLVFVRGEGLPSSRSSPAGPVLASRYRAVTWIVSR